MKAGFISDNQRVQLLCSVRDSGAWTRGVSCSTFVKRIYIYHIWYELPSNTQHIPHWQQRTPYISGRTAQTQIIIFCLFIRQSSRWGQIHRRNNARGTQTTQNTPTANRVRVVKCRARVQVHYANQISAPKIRATLFRMQRECVRMRAATVRTRTVNVVSANNN